MNARMKAKKAKEEIKRLRNKINSLESFNRYTISVDYREEERKRNIENALKLLIKRTYGRIEHTHTRIEIDEREIEGMKNYGLEIEKNLYNRTISILVR